MSTLLQVNGSSSEVHLVLYEPPDEHALLYERAECSAARLLLNIAGLRGKYTIRKRQNVRSMSSTGLVPFLAVGNTEFHAGLREIDAYLQARSALKALTNTVKESKAPLPKDSNDSQDLNDARLTESALLSLLFGTLFNCEHYIEWQADRTVNEQRIAKLYAAPLDFFVVRRERENALAYERPLCLTTRSIVECLQEANDALASLSWHLKARANNGHGPEFFSEQPALLDALIYGHFDAVLATANSETQTSVKAQLRKVFERADFDNLRRLYRKAAELYGN